MVVLLLMAPFSLKAQEDIQVRDPEPIRSGGEVFQMVEEQPQFPGGMSALMKFLANEIKYPEAAREEAAQGRVYLSFVVERDGSIADVRVMRGVHPALDQEAMRAVRAMPQWAPGRQQGQVVRTRYTLPVAFQLQ